MEAANPDQPKKDLFVIIKPTAGARYIDFVDILDELKLVGITVAPAIDDDHIDKVEQSFIEKQNIL